MKTNTASGGSHRQLFSIRGMTCRSCELLIEKKLRSLPGVTDVRASERRSEVEIFSASPLTLSAVQTALKGTSYAAHPKGNHDTRVLNDASARNGNHWFEVGGMLVLVIALYQILKTVGLFPLQANVEGVVGLSAIFIVGLTAAASTCLAVVGGLLLSVSAKWSEIYHPANRWEKFQPLLMFNIGRLFGYALLGGLIGALGTIIGLSSKGTGFLTIVIALIMIVLGLNILKILPKRYCTLPLPRSFSRKIQELSESKNPLGPALLGALTFFLPCGFTQSMQLLALASGSFASGALIMFVFALGTLPALLGISIVSAMAEGAFSRYFLKFSGALVLLLGLWNLQSGFLLTGVDAKEILLKIAGQTQATSPLGEDPFVSIDTNDQQIITMYVTEQGYQPDRFVIDAGRPTWVYAIAPENVFGCAGMLTAPTFNLSTPIQKGGNWLGPIANPTSDFTITCSMGMFRANVQVRPS
ncbi:hypothetical protein A2706_01945 [Candidatus Peribacteria bacterium RIFCSPHIGHO2_01_FULL_51_35]|nr:MAG: hypothetical protein A2706_01945 [Candidatus Peribacteria bacterium RIFCSPHIGHO2_01_FULL_51_35]